MTGRFVHSLVLMQSRVSLATEAPGLPISGTGSHDETVAFEPTGNQPLGAAPTRARIIVAAGIVALSTVGAIGLLATPSGLGQSDASDPSAAAGFLTPAEGAALTGGARLHYEAGERLVNLANGGVVPLSDDLALTVTVSPYPPTDFDVSVDLLVTTLDGQPVTDADISSVWDMTVMHHGPFETVFRPIGDGHYAASFDFFMFGPWKLTTRVVAPSRGTDDLVILSIYNWPE